MPEHASSFLGALEVVTSTGSLATVPIVPYQEPRALPEPSFLDSFQPPPPQHDSRMLDPAFEHIAQEGRVRLPWPAEVFSDSGFASGNSCGCIGICSCDYGGSRQLTTGTGLLSSHQLNSWSNTGAYLTVHNSLSSGTSTANVALGQVNSATSINERSHLDIGIEAVPPQDRFEEPDHEGMAGIQELSGTGLNDDGVDLSWWDDYVRETRPDSLW